MDATEDSNSRFASGVGEFLRFVRACGKAIMQSDTTIEQCCCETRSVLYSVFTFHLRLVSPESIMNAYHRGIFSTHMSLLRGVARYLITNNYESLDIAQPLIQRYRSIYGNDAEDDNGEDHTHDDNVLAIWSHILDNNYELSKFSSNYQTCSINDQPGTSGISSRPLRGQFTYEEVRMDPCPDLSCIIPETSDSEDDTFFDDIPENVNYPSDADTIIIDDMEDGADANPVTDEEDTDVISNTSDEDREDREENVQPRMSQSLYPTYPRDDLGPVEIFIIENIRGNAMIDLYNNLQRRYEDRNQTGGAITRSTNAALRNNRENNNSNENDNNNRYGNDDNESDDDDRYDIQPPGQRFSVTCERRKYYRIFRTYGQETTLQIRPSPPNFNPLEWVEGAFRDIITYIMCSCQAHDFVGLTIENEQFLTGPLWSRFRPARDYDVDEIWNMLSTVSQSNRGFNIDDEIRIISSVVKGIEGAGRVTLTHEGIAKKSIISITNNDNLCLPRSLVIALMYAERGKVRTGDLQRRWKEIINNNRQSQKIEALKLVQSSQMKIPRNGCGIREIKGFQNFLTNFGIAIVVYEFLTFGKGEAPIFDGRQIVVQKLGSLQHTLHILYYHRSHHYQPIINLSGAIACRKFCDVCNKSYKNVIEHRCSGRCSRCKKIPICNYNRRVVCQKCNRWFMNDNCLLNHTLPGSAGIIGKNKKASVCDALKICKKCGSIVRPYKFTHVCGQIFCQLCQCIRRKNHLCFMRRLNKINQLKTVFIFYDFETQQHENIKGDLKTKLHVPNLCVVQKVCSECCSDVNLSLPCTMCGQREFVFKDNPVEQLVELSLSSHFSKFKKIICIAHNARSFDAQFILQYLVDIKKTQLPLVILNGSKIIVMSLKKTIFLDSLNYLHMPLSKLPESFGFQNEQVKGYFPHLFNHPDNQNYIGPIPDQKYYSVDTMFEKQRTAFLKWYNDRQDENYIFNFQDEFIKYCKSDVTILRRACIEFRKMFLKNGNICPFSEATTIASACSKIYRTNFLRPDTIAILPASKSYRWSNTQSLKAIKWILTVELETGFTIINAARTIEYKLPCGITVDGYYEDPAQRIKNVYQFHGCFWHGCTRCFHINRDIKIQKNESMDDRYERTQATSNMIRTYGYNLIEKWECDFDRELAQQVHLQAHLRSHPLLKDTPLYPRDAFFGGRTENMVTLRDSNDKIHLKYVDVCSLYPYICKVGKFPVGHPKVLIGDECKKLVGNNNDLSQIEGLVKCTILPPRNLYHPVLPTRMNGKLVFALCRTCALTMCQTDCPHENEKDREFSGTWVVDEIRKAVELGYVIKYISEVWQYEITQYDPHSKTGGLFVEYINAFLKLKQEASGWPIQCVNDENLKRQYIIDYETKEGIKLDYENIEFNEGLRSLAKLILNSFWGKFGQRENLPQTEIVTTRQRLMELLTSPGIQVVGILPVSETVMYVNYVYHEDRVEPTLTSNVVIAAYVTAQARLKLYSYLERLDRRALYCDTDSVIFESKDDGTEYEPACGDFLGDLTDEIRKIGDGSQLKSFVSLGPKCYGLIIKKPDGKIIEICKVKGITLNFKNSQQINYNTLREFVTGERTKPIELKFDAIRRTVFHQVVTCEQTKNCKPVNTKRRNDGKYNTLPFGYKNV